MKECFNIITGEVDIQVNGVLASTAIINYEQVNSDYDGFILKEVVNYI